MTRSKAWQMQHSTEKATSSNKNFQSSYSRQMCNMIRRGHFDHDSLISNYPASHLTPLLQPTGHAKRRLAQRNLSRAEVSYVLLYGQSWHKAGAMITFLREKDVPFTARGDQRLQRLIGTIVITRCDSDQVVLTAYRNRRSGLQRIKQKPDYGR